jgi:2-(1,2-epoxy-1,2-dihydrophenyl)acetyl-CoA isomerase
MTPLLLVDRQGPVVLLTLNRPERHNSLVPALLEALLAALEDVARLDGVRALVLQANGRSFSTGGDMRGFYEYLDDRQAYALRLVGLLNEVILAMVRQPAPIVAAVQGQVTGGALGLVLACDLVLLSPEASFTPYYGLVGFGPDGGWTAMLPGTVGPRRAAEVLLCNGTITAEQAVAWGLAGRIVAGDHLRDEALRLALDVAALREGSVACAKRLLQQATGDLAARLEMERVAFGQQVVGDEARDGIVAFVRRERAPRQAAARA